MSDHKCSDKWVSFSLIAVAFCFSLLAAGAASAGSGAPAGPDFRPPFDFDQTGTSDVLLMKNPAASPNPNINETNMTSGGAFTTRGWPDLNTNGVLVQYETRGAGVFDGNAFDQAQILTRKTAGSNLGLVRLVKLDADGFTRATPGQTFIGGVNDDWSFVGVGDCDANGSDDIVFVNTSGGASDGTVQITLMDSSGGVLSSAFPGVLTGNVPIGVGDADGDGSADLWTDDGGVVEVLITPSDVASGGQYGTPVMQSGIPSGYEVRSIGIFNPEDTQADLVLEKTGAPNIGLVRINHSGDGGSTTNAPPVAFPVLMDSSIGEVLADTGDYNDLDQEDLLTRLLSPSNSANDGALTARLINAAGTDTVSSASPANWSNSLDFDVIGGGPNLP